LKIARAIFLTEAAGHHADLRRKQGYTVAMLVEGVASSAGHHFYHAAQDHEQFGIQHAASRLS